MGKKELGKVYNSIPYVLALPSQHSFIDYDKQADVLYLSFEKPQNATDSELVDENIIIRKRNNKIVGMTVMNASQIKYANQLATTSQN